VAAIKACRAATLGGHVRPCEESEHREIAYSSCPGSALPELAKAQPRGSGWRRARPIAGRAAGSTILNGYALSRTSPSEFALTPPRGSSGRTKPLRGCGQRGLRGGVRPYPGAVNGSGYVGPDPPTTPTVRRTPRAGTLTTRAMLVRFSSNSCRTTPAVGVRGSRRHAGARKPAHKLSLAHAEKCFLKHSSLDCARRKWQDNRPTACNAHRRFFSMTSSARQ
jgi:hypothetical protein